MVKLEHKEKATIAAGKAEAKAKAASKAPVKVESKAAKVAEAHKSEAIKTNASIEDLRVVLYPLVTEKAVNMIESENKITFIVSDKASKTDIRKVIEHAYAVKIHKINVVRDRKGRKKAIVRLDKAFKAQDLATKLKVL